MTSDRRTPDELHLEMAAQVRAVHELEYERMHPDIQNILDALCGPIDLLDGTRNEAEGINGKIDRIEFEAKTMAAKVDDLHRNGRLKLSKAATTLIATLATGIFAMLAILLQHALG